MATVSAAASETAACDFRLASEGSTFGFPEVNLGILPVPAASSTSRTGRSRRRAKELAMTGKHISAERAGEEGIVSHVYAGDEFEDEVDEFVTDLAGQAPLAIQGIKKSADMAVHSGLEEGLAYDRSLSSRNCSRRKTTRKAWRRSPRTASPEFEGEVTGQGGRPLSHSARFSTCGGAR